MNSEQTASFARFLADLELISPTIFDLRGTPEPTDAEEIRDRHHRVLDIVGELFRRDMKALREFCGADISEAGLKQILDDTWQGWLRPEYNSVVDHIRDEWERDEGHPWED